MTFDPHAGRDYHANHVLWCTNHDSEFTLHTAEEPYCSHQVGQVRLTPEADVLKGQMWVYSTNAFTHGIFTPAEYAAREALYDGIELVISLWCGPEKGWDAEQKIRITSSEARTLAAMLVRAADIEQGVDR